MTEELRREQERVSPRELARFRGRYGQEAVVTRVGRFNLVHLDRPDAETLARRTDEFDPNEWLDDDCPLCTQMRKAGGDIVFDERDAEDDDWKY